MKKIFTLFAALAMVMSMSAKQVSVAAEPEYEVYEDEITNMQFDLENMRIIGGPSASFDVEVILCLGEENLTDATFKLSPESSVVIQGTGATFVEGYAYEIDINAPTAKAVVKVQWNDMYLEFHLSMSVAPIEATVVVVENATIEIDTIPLFDDVVDFALTMTGEWVDAEGLVYPVLVDIPVYYPEATEPTEIPSTVTVGSMDEGANWLGYGEGTLTITTVDGVITATGVVENSGTGVAIDITISGEIMKTSLENVNVTAVPIKMIQNGQLIIKHGHIDYNANGTVVK